MYICLCQQITDSDIKQAISSGQIDSNLDLANKLGIGLCCGTCTQAAEEILQESLLDRKKTGTNNS